MCVHTAYMIQYILLWLLSLSPLILYLELQEYASRLLYMDLDKINLSQDEELARHNDMANAEARMIYNLFFPRQSPIHSQDWANFATIKYTQ